MPPPSSLFFPADCEGVTNRLGRFSSPDPIAGSTTDPQSLNRYSYVRNMPAILVDPSGQTSCFSAQQNSNQDDTSAVGGNGPGPSLREIDNDSAEPQSGSGCWQVSQGGGGTGSIYLDGGDFTDYSGDGLGSQPDAWVGWSPGPYEIYGYSDDGFRIVGFGFFFPPSSSGNPSGDSFIESLYKKYLKALNDCIQKVFSLDYKNGKVPDQNLGNAPALDTSKTGDQMRSMCTGADKTAGCNAPPQDGGSNGTIYIASDQFNRTGTNALVDNYGTYVHELGNILDARVYPKSKPGDMLYESHHPNTHLNDGDTGANLEDCFLNAIRNLKGN